MKRLAYTTMLTTVALALAVGCSKEKKDDGQDKTAPAAAVKTPAKTDDAKTKPTLTATDTKKSKLLVLKFHHDSWGGCIAMGPIAKAAQEKYTDKSIQFVTFDFTSDETKAKAEADAKALGVAELFAKNAPKTGFALLVDTSTNSVLTKLSARQDVVAWSAEIDKGFGG